ncbi:hypothetical protein ACFVRD_21805 [Streptomyces sp. NPDC057908]|uniref:hypothetical protein n=1 Tax=Streptomyces sp. NPDC057908 TaxID=3346276 RepID=UPI0036F06072
MDPPTGLTPAHYNALQLSKPTAAHTLADAASLRTFAGRKGIGALSQWATFRDQECTDEDTLKAVDTCSGVAQEAGAFARALGG